MSSDGWPRRVPAAAYLTDVISIFRSLCSGLLLSAFISYWSQSSLHTGAAVECIALCLIKRSRKTGSNFPQKMKRMGGHKYLDLKGVSNGTSTAATCLCCAFTTNSVFNLANEDLFFTTLTSQPWLAQLDLLERGSQKNYLYFILYVSTLVQPFDNLLEVVGCKIGLL